MDISRDEVKPANCIMISWIDFHGRSAGIADSLSIQSFFFSGGDGGVLRRYRRQWSETRRLLKKTKGATKGATKAIVMMPPLPALLAVAMSPKLRIAGDLHTGVFRDPKWKWALPLTLSVLKRRGIGIVTNSDLAEILDRKGVASVVLHDQITDDYIDDYQRFDSPELSDLDERDWILVPLAYAYDEPLSEILQAATFTPEIAWVLTGKAPQTYIDSAPSNVIFPGYISEEDYRRAVARSSAIAALTTDENTMQRAGYEAMSAGQALLTTPMKVLKEFFGAAPVYSSPTGVDLAAGARKVIRDAPLARKRMEIQRELRHREQSASLSYLREWMDN